MPVPQQRDPELTRKHLTTWLAERLPEAADLRVRVEVPQGLGFSNETLLVDTKWGREGAEEHRRLVVRVAPTRYRVMPGSRLDEEYRVLDALRDTDVPVPGVVGFEADPGLLGAPFYAMDRVEGWVPPDLPSYHRDGGPVSALDEGGRAAVWWGGVEALHRIHRLDVGALGLDALRLSVHGPYGLGAQLDYYEAHMDHFGGADSVPVREALALLRDGLPPEPERPSLLWGDARLGNLMFSGVAPVAVLDWEMTFLGPGEADLGWYLYLDRHLSEGVGAPRLPGLPGRAETILRYEELAGRPVAAHMDWYEVFAGFRFALIASRVGRLLVEHGLVAAEADVPLARNAANLLARTLEPLG
ncbi:phosphotransferase family protein [Streptomyces melanogenes]|uniref:Phosphotransferase family protein n=1 Tax=Streptomyces melanogenes TaxID=67326 RepID=A0ABZ1XD82_9ACTN|nr:phosphotransferase family protein [Streptomyces melanogenes]